MNILCIGQRITGISIFLQGRFSNDERHRLRFERTLALESNYMSLNIGVFPIFTANMEKQIEIPGENYNFNHLHEVKFLDFALSGK